MVWVTGGAVRNEGSGWVPVVVEMAGVGGGVVRVWGVAGVQSEGGCGWWWWFSLSGEVVRGAARQCGVGEHRHVQCCGSESVSQTVWSGSQQERKRERSGEQVAAASSVGSLTGPGSQRSVVGGVFT